MKLKEFVAVHPGAALFFPNGVPQSVEPPGWGIDDPMTEMCLCQKEFFLEHANAVPDIPLEKVNKHFDCIGFMGSYEALPWIGIWICGTIYAEDVTNDNHNIGEWTEFQFARILQDGICEFSIEAIDYFRDRFVCEPDVATEFYAGLEKFKQKHLENQVP